VRTIGLVCALLAVVAVSGCSGGSKTPIASSPTGVATSASSSPPTVASPTTDASPTPTITSSPSSVPTSGTPECLSSSLQLRAVPLGAATGTDYIALVVTNTGDADCALVGYPGVTFLDGHGQQVGLPAQRDRTSKPRRIVIAAGEKAHAQLSYPNPDFFGSGCGGTHAKSVQFFPPDQTAPLRADVDAFVCTDKRGRSMVGAMRPGTRGA
jgi:uncharacterized protein DUF4232